MSWWILYGLIPLLFPLILLYRYSTRNFNYWKDRGVMQIEPTLIFGSISELIFQTKPCGYLYREWYEKYPKLPYVGYYVLDKPCLLIRDPDLVKYILMKDFSCFHSRVVQSASGDIVGQANLALMKNPSWSYVRNKIRPLYASSKLKLLFELMLEVSDDLRRFLESLNLDEQGLVIDANQLTRRITVDQVASTTFGVKSDCLHNPNSGFWQRTQKMVKFTTYRGYEVLVMFCIPQFAQTIRASFFTKEATKFLRECVWDIIDAREQSGAKRPDLIDLLMKIRRSQSDEEKKIIEFDGDNLVAQAAILFSGGLNTSSALIAFTLYELALHPNVQNKVRKEMKEAFDKVDGKLTYDIVATELGYLDMVLSETLRLHPPIPYTDRVASEDYKIPNSDLTIEKGTTVLIPMLGLHLDEKYFPDPHRFNPANFSPEAKKMRKSCVYLPFGEGPRMCLGLRLGLLQAKLALSTMLLNYEIAPCDKTVVPLKWTPRSIGLTVDGGLYLKLRKFNL